MKYWDIKPYKPRTTKKKKIVQVYPNKYIPGPIEIAPHPPICDQGGTTINYDPSTYHILSKEDMILYNPNLISITKRVISS